MNGANTIGISTMQYNAIALSFTQDHILWYNDEELRGVEYFAEVTHNHKIRFEDDVEFVRNDYFHVSRRGNSEQPTRLEYLVHNINNNFLFSVSYNR